jgi:hypothetical protein
MKPITKIIFISMLFVLAGILFSNPLIFNFNSTIPYAYAPAPIYSDAHLVPGDHLLLYYTYWLFKDYFITPGQELLREPYTFSINGWPRPYEPKELASSLLFLLFSIFGNAFAYNSMMIISFLLSGLFTYLLAKKYTNHTGAAIVSGIIFAVSPFRLTQLFGGHPIGIILFWLPCIIYLYELLWEKQKWMHGWIAGTAIFCMSIEEHHMGYYTALFTAAFWVYKFVFCNSKKKLNFIRSILLFLPVACGWVASLGYMIYIKTTVISTSIAHAGRTFEEIRLFSPSIHHVFRRINPDGEKCIYIGVIALIFIFLGIAKRIFVHFKHRNLPQNFPFTFYLLTFFITLLLSLGPNLTIFPLYKICYKIIPFFSMPRATARIFMFTLLSASLLAGYGIKALTDLFRKKTLQHLIICISILLICTDFYTFPKIGLCRLDKGNRTYEYIKNSFPKNPLLEIPLWPGEASWTGIYQYFTTIYRTPIINGYSPFVTKQYIDEIFWPLVSINMGMINTEQYELLKKLDIKYINLHEEAYPQKVNPFPFKIALDNLNKSPYIRFVLKDGPMYLFEVLEKPSNKPLMKYTLPSKVGIFFECEYMPHRVGNITEDKTASENLSLFADQPVTEPQHMVFGPWQLFPPGKYKILFRTKTEMKQSAGKVATLEVSTDQGKKTLISKDISGDNPSGEYEDHLLHFALDKLTVLEFRIIYYGTGPIWADYIYLLCEEENDPELLYYAKDLFHTGREIDSIVSAIPNLDPPGKFVFGPYRKYPDGKYKIGFNLKAGKTSNETGAILKVKSPYSDIPKVSLSLQDIPVEYTTYFLELRLENPSVLEFQIEFTGKIPIFVDSIKIEPQNK